MAAPPPTVEECCDWVYEHCATFDDPDNEDRNVQVALDSVAILVNALDAPFSVVSRLKDRIKSLKQSVSPDQVNQVVSDGSNSVLYPMYSFNVFRSSTFRRYVTNANLILQLHLRIFNRIVMSFILNNQGYFPIVLLLIMLPCGLINWTIELIGSDNTLLASLTLHWLAWIRILSFQL